jgi:hypothetical protein
MAPTQIHQVMTKSERSPVSVVAGAAAAAQVRGAMEGASLCEALDRLLNTGVVVVGDAAVTVAEIDLLRIQFQLVLSSAARSVEST